MRSWFPRSGCQGRCSRGGGRLARGSGHARRPPAGVVDQQAEHVALAAAVLVAAHHSLVACRGVIQVHDSDNAQRLPAIAEGGRSQREAPLGPERYQRAAEKLLDGGALELRVSLMAGGVAERPAR